MAITKISRRVGCGFGYTWILIAFACGTRPASGAPSQANVTRTEWFSEIAFDEDIQTVALAPDSKTMAVCFRKLVQIWHVSPPRLVASWDMAKSSDVSMRLTDDRLLILRNDDMAIWRIDFIDISDVAKPRLITSKKLMKGLTVGRSGIGLLKDSLILLVSEIDNTDTEVIKSWSLADGSEHERTHKVPGVMSFCLSASGSQIATIDVLGRLEVRKMSTFETTRSQEVHSGDAIITFGNDDRLLMCRSAPSGHLVVDVESPKKGYSIPAEVMSVESPIVAFRECWIGGKSDGRIVIYDALARKVRCESKAEDRPIGCLAVSIAVPAVISSTVGGKSVRVWNVEKLGLAVKDR